MLKSVSSGRYSHIVALEPSPNHPKIFPTPRFPTWTSLSLRTHFSSSPDTARIFDRFYPNAEFLRNSYFLGYRYFSTRNEVRSKNLLKDVVMNPVVAVKDTFLWYKEVISLQIKDLPKRNDLTFQCAVGYAMKTRTMLKGNFRKEEC